MVQKIPTKSLKKRICILAAGPKDFFRPKPKVIITLGKEAYAKVTSENENFSSVRGHVIDFKNYKLVPIFHPTYLIRNPDEKKIAFNDLKTIKSLLC